MRRSRSTRYESIPLQVNYFTASFHDSVILLCKSLMESQQEDPLFHTYSVESIRHKILKQMRNVTFLGISGNVTIDEEGDRIADYALLDQTNTESGLFEVGHRVTPPFYLTTGCFPRLLCATTAPPGRTSPYARSIGPTASRPTIGPNVALMAPNAKVLCHFHPPPKCDSLDCLVFLYRIHILGSYDLSNDNTTFHSHHFGHLHIQASSHSALSFLVGLFLCCHRKIKYNASLTNMSWKIRWEDIEQISSDSLIQNEDTKV